MRNSVVGAVANEAPVSQTECSFGNSHTPTGVPAAHINCSPIVARAEKNSVELKGLINTGGYLRRRQIQCDERTSIGSKVDTGLQLFVLTHTLEAIDPHPCDACCRDHKNDIRGEVSPKWNTCNDVSNTGHKHCECDCQRAKDYVFRHAEYSSCQLTNQPQRIAAILPVG
jgi:hypothetical protein